MKTSKRIKTRKFVCICALFDLKRDAYYKFIKRYKIKEEQEQKVIELVSLRRTSLPRIGCRKLHKYLQPDFERAKLKIGRDRLFNVLRANKMLVKPKKTSCRTTNSYHHFHKYNNLIFNKDTKQLQFNPIKVA
jgi:hypothetical protein